MPVSKQTDATNLLSLDDRAGSAFARPIGCNAKYATTGEHHCQIRSVLRLGASAMDCKARSVGSARLISNYDRPRVA